MRYRVDPERRDPGYALFAEDMIPADPINGGAYVRKPSDQLTTIKGASATTIQHLGVFRKRSGFVGVSVVDGEIYTLSGTTWSRQVTTANLTTASITMSATVRVFCVSFNNTYVFNDGVNQPFTWDGTAGAGGLTLLSNAPSKCYGKPTVYYGKLFFIKDAAASSADRSKIVWSEEYAANTGYEASGYANVWTLEQSGSGALYALVGTNSGLYYFRRDGIGVIRGAVTPAFTTSGVHDDVSSVVGTTCPDVRWYENYIYFFDERGRPWRLPENGRLDPIYLELADLWTTPDTPGQGLVNTTAYDPTKSNVAPWPWVDAVVFGAHNATNQPFNWAFSHRTGKALCRYSPNVTSANTPTIIGATYDSTNGRTVLCAAMVNGAGPSAFGAVNPVISGSFFDATDGGGALVTRRIILGPFGGVAGQLWRLQSAAVTAALGASSSARTGTVGLSVSSSTGSGLYPYANFTAQTSKAFPATSTSYQQQARKAWSFNLRQRWMTISVSDGGAFEGWGIYQVVVMGTPEYIEGDTP